MMLAMLARRESCKCLPMDNRVSYPGKLAVLQRVFPTYRVPFFDGLAAACPAGMELFAGEPRAREGIHTHADGVRPYVRRARNLHIASGALYSCWQRGVTAWLREFSPDVLIVEANPRLLSSFAGIRLMRSWGRPVIGWGLGVLDWTAARWVVTGRAWALRRFYRRFDALIAYSSKGADDYRALGFPAARIFVAPNAVSGAEAQRVRWLIAENPALIAEWKAALGLTDKPVVLFVGRLVPEKRVSDLIEACALLRDGCELLVVGDGPALPGLESLATRLLPQTRFLGHRTGEELGLCFAGADLFVLPGSGGLAVQEAMAYGKPVVVASADGTQSDLVREGRNGFHVPAGDLAALTRTIEACIGDRSLLETMGRESWRIASEEHSLDAMVRTFLKTLEFVSGPVTT